MLWECGNSLAFYFLMGYLPAIETRGIALRGIIVMKYCVFVFPCICLFVLALWHGIDVVYRKYDTVVIISCLTATDLATYVFYRCHFVWLYDLLLQNKNFKENWTPEGLQKLHYHTE